MTSTATLQAALDVMKNSDPSIGYSIAYPFGVIGPILCIYFMTRQVKPKFPPKSQRFHMGEITLGDSFTGQTFNDLLKVLPAGVDVTMIRKDHQNVVPAGRLRFRPATRFCDRRPQEASPRRRETRQARSGPYRQGPFVARLHPRVCQQGQYGWRSAWAAGYAKRLSGPRVTCAPLRRGYCPDAGPDAGIRRSRRRADAARAQGSDPHSTSATP